MNRLDRCTPARLRRNPSHSDIRYIRKESTLMNSQYALARVIYAERLARGMAEREADRLARQRPSQHPIRRAIGRSMVRIGIRLAEPNLRPARSR
jgi:hypothetical protein